MNAEILLTILMVLLTTILILFTLFDIISLLLPILSKKYTMDITISNKIMFRIIISSIIIIYLAS